MMCYNEDAERKSKDIVKIDEVSICGRRASIAGANSRGEAVPMYSEDQPGSFVARRQVLAASISINEGKKSRPFSRIFFQVKGKFLPQKIGVDPARRSFRPGSGRWKKRSQKTNS